MRRRRRGTRSTTPPRGWFIPAWFGRDPVDWPYSLSKHLRELMRSRSKLVPSRHEGYQGRPYTPVDNWVFRESMPSGVRLTYLSILWRADPDTGWVRVSTKDLAHELRVKPKTVRSRLLWLERRKRIIRVRRAEGDEAGDRRETAIWMRPYIPARKKAR